MRTDLKALLMEYGCPSPDIIHEGIIPECLLSFLQIRDRLYRMGKILFEDTESQVYVAMIRSGFGNMNHAVVAMQLRSNKLMVAGYAREGLVKQNIWGKAFEKLKSVVQNTESAKPTKIKHTFRIVLLSVVLILVLTGSLFFVEVQKTVDATKEYNTAVQAFNSVVSEYNSAVALTSVDNISGLPVSLDPLKTEAEGFWPNARIVLSQNNTDKILADAHTINEMTTQVQAVLKVVTQITAPTSDWVASRLSNVVGITETQAVTDELDPDDLLGKEGGYSGCIYFTFEAINPDEVPGNSVVEKGTDAGGAVEIYPSLADAKARCEYLEGFNGTVLYSGSYAIIGTMVVRTSYKLSNEQQFDLTNAITAALTSTNQIYETPLLQC